MVFHKIFIYSKYFTNCMLEIGFLADIGIIITVATIFAYLASAIKQPLIPAYIFAGILIGPVGLSLITSQSYIMALSELGIAFLLFIVGMELDLRRLRGVGIFPAVAGIAQILLVFGAGYLAGAYLGFTSMESFYTGLILAFSSTMVVIKLLADNVELNTLHGRIIIGILLVQDLLVVLALSIISNINNLTPEIFSLAVVKGLGLFSMALLSSKYLLPVIFKYAAKSQELLFLTAVTMCFLFGGAAYLLDFSIAVGAFIAGVGMAAFPYNLEIIGRIRSLRDFFATMFFVSLGMQFSSVSLSGLLVPTLVLLGICVIVKPAILILLSVLYGYEQRTAFIVGIDLAQISEFSLILVALGVTLGHVGADLFAITTILAIISIGFTSYFVEYDEAVYHIFSDMMSRLHGIVPNHRKKRLEHKIKELEDHTILIGCHMMGYDLIKELKHKNLVVVDYNPEVIRGLIEDGIPCIYGDIGNIEILERLNIHDAKLIISTIPSFSDNELLIKRAKEENSKAILVVSTQYVDQALELYSVGADFVVMPKYLTGRMLAIYTKRLIHGRLDIKDIRRNHIRTLKGIAKAEILDRFGPTFLKTLK